MLKIIFNDLKLHAHECQLTRSLSSMTKKHKLNCALILFNVEFAIPRNKLEYEVASKTVEIITGDKTWRD